MLSTEEPESTEPGEDKDFGMLTCMNCEQPFMKKRSWQLFCSTACRMQSHQLEREAAVREYRLMKKQRNVPNVE